MPFESLIDSVLTWAQRGKYAAYVWPAYGLSALVLAGLLVASRRGQRRAEAELEQLQQARGRRRAPRPETQA